MHWRRSAVKAQKSFSLIDKFREIQPADTESMSREMKKTDLTVFFAGKKKEFQNLARLHGSEVLMDIPGETISSMIYPEYYDELFNNIFLSTLKYSAPGGQIHVSVKPEGTDDDRKLVVQFRYSSVAGAAGTDAAASAGGLAGFPVESASGVRLALIKKLIHLLGGNISVQLREDGVRTIILELLLLEEMTRNYEDIEVLLQTGDILLFKGLYYNRWGERSVATDWTHVGMIVRMPGYSIPLIWESTPLENVPDQELRSKKSGAQLVSLRERLEKYETDVYAIRFLRVIRDASMLNKLYSFIYSRACVALPWGTVAGGESDPGENLQPPVSDEKTV